MRFSLKYLKLVQVRIILAALFFLPCQILSQISTNEQNFKVVAVKIDHDLELTGRMSDPAWTNAPSLHCPFEIQPGENSPARKETRVRILYNDRFLYVGFVCNDPDPASIRAHVSDRDNIFQDDFVFVGIDPYRGNQRAYEFAANPLGIQGDLMRIANNDDATWDAVWYSKGVITDSGYTVEIAIPFKSISFPSEAIEDWSLMIIRNDSRESDYHYSWTSINKNDPCSICMAGTLVGLKGLETTSTTEILPYGMGYQSGALKTASDPASGFSDGKVSGRFGVGAKYAPNSSLWFEGVANPDFSQVESDATQISVNSTFAIYYPERRPFFQDDADIFTTDMRQFYSRMVNNPLGAAKIVSKGAHLTVAYIGAEDRNSPFVIPGEEGNDVVTSQLQSFSNILRAKYEFGSRAYLGTLLTMRNFSHGHNYSGSIDWSLPFADYYTFHGQALVSDTHELNDTLLFSNPTGYGSSGLTKEFDGERFGGTGLYAQLRRDVRELSLQTTYTDLSQAFQTQDGFITANDMRMVDFVSDYFFYPHGSLVDVGDVYVEGNLQFNYEGARKQRWSVAEINLQLKSQTTISYVYVPYNEELFRSVRFFAINRSGIRVNSSPSSEVQISSEFALGKFIYRGDGRRRGGDM